MASPLKCDLCSKPATVHLTQIVNNKVHKVDLCEACAQAKGVTDPSGFSLADLLLKASLTPDGAATDGLRCEHCGFTQGDFKKHGRFGCPHCYEFEPLLTSWVSKLPSDVAFVRSHAIWNAGTKFHAQILSTQQALGSFEKTHQVVFDAIHKQHINLTSQEAVRTLFASNGIAPADFDKAWTSFAVSSGVKQAETRTKDYQVDSVPTLVVNGKYRVTLGDAVPSPVVQLKVVDFLLAKERVGLKH